MKKRALPFLLIELCVFCFLLAGVLGFRPQEIPVSLRDFSAKGGTWDDSGWTTDPGAEKTGSFLVSPALSLPRGSYLLTVGYEAERDQSLRLTDKAHPGIVLPEQPVVLSHYKKVTSERCDISADESDVHLSIGYDGQGAFRVTSVRLVTSSAMQRRQLFLFILFCLLLDIWLFSPGFRKDPFPLAAVLGITLACSLPLFMNKMVKGYDCGFHLSRIESLTDGLRRGVFPLRVSTIDLFGWGYMPSIYYGDILLYVPAVLRIIGFSITAAYKGYIFFINLATAAVSYFCFTRTSRNRKAGALMALIYCSGTYRIFDIYVRMAVGEYSAMVFLPMIAAGFYDLAKKELPDKNACIGDAILMGAGYAGLVCNHLLTTEIALAASVIAFVVLLPRMLRPRVLLTFAGGALLAILLAGYYDIPLLDCMKNDVVYIFAGLKDRHSIQRLGAYAAQLFSFFFDVYDERQPLTAGLVSMAALVWAGWLLASRKGNRKILILSVLSLLYLWISSDLCPWNWIEHSPLKVMTAIQYPWRWIAAARLPLTLLCGELLLSGKLPKWAPAGALAACLVSLCIFTGQFTTKNIFMNLNDTAEIANWNQIGDGEYLPCTRDEHKEICVDNYYLTDEITAENLDSFELLSRDRNNKFVLNVSGSPQDGSLCLPVLRYRGYVVRDAQGKAMVTDDGPNCCIRIAIPAGYSGTVTLTYEEPLLWRIGDVLTILSLLGCLIEAIRLQRKKAVPSEDLDALMSSSESIHA